MQVKQLNAVKMYLEPPAVCAAELWRFKTQINEDEE